MTRETKIGLLVGLAFIIVIGILLSDHLTSSTEPPPATLANAGNSVMQTINTPSSATTAQAQSLNAPQGVAPNHTVPTAADLTPRPKPVQIVQVGPGSASQAQPITVQSQQPDQQVQQDPSPPTPIVMTPDSQPLAQNPAGDTPVITHEPISTDSSLVQLAQRNGESLVAVDPSLRSATETTPPAWVQSKSSGSRSPGMREYTAQSGDSVSRMALRFLGANTKANRDLIISANPSLQKDPNKVILGQTYLIPTPAEQPSAATAQTTQQDQPVDPGAPSASVASVAEYWYTVREHDSLWKIANEQLGKPSAVAAIKELNKETLQGSDTLYVGMKLKLPGKPLAQAQ